MHEKQRLLHKFSKGRCSQEELRQLFKYLKEEKEELEGDCQAVMNEVWQELHTPPPLKASVSEAMYEAIKRRLQSDGVSLPASPTRSATGARIFLFPDTRATAKTAAVFASVLLSAWLLYLLVTRTDQIRYETTFGATTTVELPDHSTVTLNGNSRIRYSRNWKKTKVREVWLDGEAFFSVAHTADDQKFIVHTNNMEIEVLGTEFNVNNRRGATKVTLSSGVVRLNGKGNAWKVKDVMMHPGEHASLDKNYDFHLKRVDIRQYTTWKDNVMVFDHTAVSEVAIMIEETYGMQVLLQGDSVQYLELSGFLPANDIHALLGMLKETLELEVSNKDGEIIISKK
jgi:transmembrane sensor